MTILQPGLILALCTPFVLAGWIAYMHRERATAIESTAANRTVDSAGFDPTNPRLMAETIDLEVAVREAAAGVNSLARTLWVRIEQALGAPMTVHVDPNALGMALRETMLSAIRATPGGQVLVTAVTLGSQLHIRITDDGLGADQREREILAREAAAKIALQGGSISVEARPGQGTTVTVRLPLPGELRGEAGEACKLKRPHVLAKQAA